MEKVAIWLSNTITPEAAIYEFEKTILPKIHDTKKMFEKRKIEDNALHQDIERSYTDINKLAQSIIAKWNKKLQLTEQFEHVANVEQLPVFTDNVIKNKIYSIGRKFNSVYSDQYWKAPTTIIKDIQQILSNVSVINTEYEKKQNPTYKRWFLVGGYTTPTGTKRALWIMITASGAGSANNPLDKYDITVTVETLSPKNVHPNQGQEYLENIGVI